MHDPAAASSLIRAGRDRERDRNDEKNDDELKQRVFGRRYLQQSGGVLPEMANVETESKSKSSSLIK
jgi:hypothetical protein